MVRTADNHVVVVAIYSHLFTVFVRKQILTVKNGFVENFDINYNS